MTDEWSIAVYLFQQRHTGRWTKAGVAAEIAECRRYARWMLAALHQPQTHN